MPPAMINSMRRPSSTSRLPVSRVKYAIAARAAPCNTASAGRIRAHPTGRAGPEGGAVGCSMSARVLADAPAFLREEALSRLDRRRFEFGRHRVIEPVEKPEQRNHRDDIDDLRVGVM